MPIVLPEAKRAPVLTSPASLLIYGLPKIGKTGKVAELEDCLIIDLEKGSLAHEAMSVQATNLSEFNEILNSIREENKKLVESGSDRKYRYKYICIDTVDELEEFADAWHTAYYNMDVKRNPTGSDGKKREFVKSIADLPYGRGYGYIREEVKSRLKATAKLCEKLIVVSHVKDKEIAQKQGVDIKDKDLSLSGKLGSIVCAMMDAIGFVYRDEFETDDQGRHKLKISFDTAANSATMGARFKYLAGKQMDFNWSDILK